MKKISIISAILVLVSSFTAFAEEHADAALEHTKFAIEGGKQGSGPSLVEHANTALTHAKAAAEVATGESKKHMEAAVKSLEKAIKHGEMKGEEHVKTATQEAEQAEKHLKAGNQ